MKYTINQRLHKEAIKQMKVIVQALKEDLQSTDFVSLDLLADALDVFHTASDGLSQSSLVITNAQGNLVANPYIKIKNDAQITAFKIMKQFGLNPLDNKKLRSGIETDEPSALDEFMKGE